MASGPPVGGEDGAREIQRYSENKVYARKAFKGPRKAALTSTTPTATATATATVAAEDTPASNPSKANENNVDNENNSGGSKEVPSQTVTSEGANPAPEPTVPPPQDTNLTPELPIPLTADANLALQPRPIPPSEDANLALQPPNSQPEVANSSEPLPVSEHEDANLTQQPPVSQPEGAISTPPPPLVSQADDANFTPQPPVSQIAVANSTLQPPVPQPEPAPDGCSLNQQQPAAPTIREPPLGNGLVEKTGLDGKFRINLSSQSKQEMRELRKRLQGELNTVRTWVKRIEEKEGQIVGFSHSHVIEHDAVDNGASRAHSEVAPVSVPPPPLPPPPRETRPLNQLSVSVLENSQGLTESVEKEKRTPKANQFYRNSEFLLAKDKFPPAESNKKSKANGKKKGGDPRGGPGMGAKFFKSCSSLLEKLMKHQYGWVFNTPVDVEGLGLHDYYSIIKHPMDLGTVKARLNANIYRTPKEFAEDVRLTFHNAMTYNPKGQDVHFMATTLLKIFDERWVRIESDYLRELRIGFDYDMGIPTPIPRRAPPYLQPPLDVRRVLDRSESMTYPSDLRPKPISITPSGRTPAPKKPKAKDPYKREMTFDEKQKLSTNLQNLPSDKLDNIVQIIRKRNSALCQQDDEIEVDIDSVDTETLWELDRFVTNYKKSLSKNKRKAELAMQARLQAQQNAPDKDMAPPATEVPKETDAGQKIVSSSSPVQVDKQGANSSRSSSSNSSSSDSGSSTSDSDSDSSSGSDSDAEHSPRT
ncbi:transcription factor GTE4 [Punica granatum]|uniref:Transcription factor GTE4 n=1 Tax=Punica granatum TaxID=22663 RepID=A0A6P8D0U0_PUNGR|nr:transcription factor GTE4 [Punica granatum]